jgi:hypothetical protein
LAFNMCIVVLVNEYGQSIDWGRCLVPSRSSRSLINANIIYVASQQKQCLFRADAVKASFDYSPVSCLSRSTFLSSVLESQHYSQFGDCFAGVTSLAVIWISGSILCDWLQNFY